MVQKILLPVIFLLLSTGIIKNAASTDRCSFRDHGRIRLTGPSEIKNEGGVQLCTQHNNYDQGMANLYYQWTYISTNGWTDEAANVACRELGFSNTRNIKNKVTLEESAQTVKEEAMCSGQENTLTECFDNNPLYIGQSGDSPVAGLVCRCSDGSLRLVGGSVYREGRVEVCVDGRWGTVCGEGWGDTQAALVCTKLGFPADDSTLHYFGEGSGPMYTTNCHHILPTSASSDCLWTPATSCNHSSDLGVRCSACDGCNNKALGASTGVLIAALVIIAMGWIVSCVYWWKKAIHRQSQPVCPGMHSQGQVVNMPQMNLNDHTTRQQLHNPMYELGSSGMHIQSHSGTLVSQNGKPSQINGYNDLGHTYECLEADHITDYDKVNRRRAPRPHPPMESTELQNPSMDHDYNTLAGNQYHVLELSSTAEVKHIM